MIALDASYISYSIAVVGLLAGAIGGVAAFRKAGPESSQILVSAASDVVLIQKGLVTDLDAKMEALQQRVDDLEAKRRIVENEALTLRRENTRLVARVDMLEKELARHGIRLTAEENRNTVIEEAAATVEKLARQHGTARDDEHFDKEE